MKRKVVMRTFAPGDRVRIRPGVPRDSRSYGYWVAPAGTMGTVRAPALRQDHSYTFVRFDDDPKPGRDCSILRDHIELVTGLDLMLDLLP